MLPKWLFEKDVESRFISSINRQTQTYNKAVIPTCSDCNNTILVEIENSVINILQNIEIGNHLSDGDFSNIIRWLEILDYKLQVYDCRRKCVKHRNSEYDPVWGIMPVACMRHFIDMNPFKAHDYLRRSQRRIAVKSKLNRFQSLVLFEMSEPDFDFFAQPRMNM